MDLTKLRNNQIQLIEYMKKGGYSTSYINDVQNMINRLLENEKNVVSYLDYYNNFLEEKSKNMKYVLNLIRNFDLYDEFPIRTQRNHFILDDSAILKLNETFKSVLTIYKKEALRKGLKNSTIRCSISCCSNFLLHLQNKGYKDLSNVKEKDILSFFTDNNGNLKYSSQYKNIIKLVFKYCEPYIDDCKKIINLIPRIKYRRKNIQCLSYNETKKIKEALEDSNMCLRNKAIISLALYTGLRCIDIVNLKLSDIDWKKDKISIIQEKTGVPLELPLLSSYGNILYDYITKERPKADIENVFIRLDANLPLKVGGVISMIRLFFSKNDICGTKRKGTHIFRHNITNNLLKNEIPQYIISHILGHVLPESINPYLHTDFYHLKQQALDISEFECIERKVIK